MKKSIIVIFFVYCTTIVVGYVFHDREIKKYGLFLKESERVMLIDLASEFNFQPTEEFKNIIICRLFHSNQDVSSLIERYGQSFAREAEVILRDGSLVGTLGVYELYDLSEKEVEAICHMQWPYSG